MDKIKIKYFIIFIYMYIVTAREYKNQNTIVLNKPDSYRACLELLYDTAIQYINNKQGNLLPIDKLIYKKNSYPDFRGKHIFYIQKSFSYLNIDNIDKFYVIKRTRGYGFFYNDFKISKKLRLEICYIHEYKFPNNGNWSYDVDDIVYNNYDALLKEFSEYANTKILPKLEPHIN